MKHLICPMCSLTLIQNQQGLACANGHQFDRAKEGYFNLLPVQLKNSREPGDAKQQLMARRRFLTAGYFSPLVDALAKVIDPTVADFLDLGCGEGYFTRALGDHCTQADTYGVDIAKAGIRLASKHKRPRENFIVASSHSLPLADESMDVITRIYAPSKDDELFRVLKPEGRLVIVTPGEQHLIGLRQKIYQVIKPHPAPKTPAGFASVAERAVSFPLRVTAGELTASLLGMTPFAWKLTQELRSRVEQNGLADEADFQISVYRKVS